MKLSDRTATSNKTGGYIHIILPDGEGLFTSYKISEADFLKGAGTEALILPNLTGSKLVAMVDNVYVSQISLKLYSGTPFVKIGLSAGGDDLMPETAIDFNQVKVESLFSASDIIYFTITGGNVNIRIDQIKNFI